jgi:hypothetical protein
MRKALILALCLAGCGRGTGGNGQAGSAESSPRAVQTATLTGLYESNEGPRRSQLCIVERGGESRFGLVTWRGEGPGCSGAGAAVRRGDTLRLTMAGEAACAIEAPIDGGRVAFPATAPPGCRYYCAPGAVLEGAFDKVGGTSEDALRARDLVGDPLCG